ncbi:MAG: STAS domain-containing protein [Kiritimatiellia bacterium]
MLHGGVCLSDRLLVAVQERRAYVKPVGRATFKLAPALKRFSVSVISKGCRDVLFDMSECTTLDSTFMGVLAGIAMWPLGTSDKVHVTLKGLNARTRSMLATLGLERIMTCFNQDEDSVGKAVSSIDLAARAHEVQHDAGKEETLATMRTAHADLVRADEENAARFCDVLTYLDQEIKRVDD